MLSVRIITVRGTLSKAARRRKQAPNVSIMLVAPKGRPTLILITIADIGTTAIGRGSSQHAYWKAVSEKFLSLRECSRSIGMSANFSIALMPMVRCWATCRL
jgi:hypothetical protein